jgi:alpha,alpha-trehalase
LSSSKRTSIISGGELQLPEVELDRHGKTLPSALDREEEIGQRLSGRRLAVFLDYDGTLTPIVDRPELAVMSAGVRAVVRRLAASCTTAIVSGRSRARVFEFVGIDEIFYAGSHGLDIAGPRGSRILHEEGRSFLPVIDKAYEELKEQVKDIDGGLVEHTGFSISVHYRLVPEGQVPVIEGVVDRVLSRWPRLRKMHGKMVFELRPRMEWDKGKAVLWILRALDLDVPDVIPLYLGDDTTDEDAFREVRDRGIGILVAETPRPSAASYCLRNPLEVKQFLEVLITLVGKTD